MSCVLPSMTVDEEEVQVTSRHDDMLLWLQSVAQQGGPHPEQYPRLNQVVLSLHQSREVRPERLRATYRILQEVLSADTMQGHAFRKPRGYAGDYEIIDRIYASHVCTDSNFARWDHFFHAQPAPRAVRNRKAYFHDRLDELCRRHLNPSVLKLGVGPGRSMYEWFCRHASGAGHALHIDCVDIDAAALDYANSLNAEFVQHLRFLLRNALRFTPDRQYSMIWSAGLFDYFDDKLFVRLLGRYVRYLEPAGEIIIGNFADGNPSRAYMEVIGNWHLHHRTPEQLRTLAEQSGIAYSRIEVDAEPEGINLFLRIKGC